MNVYECPGCAKLERDAVAEVARLRGILEQVEDALALASGCTREDQRGISEARGLVCAGLFPPGEESK